MKTFKIFAFVMVVTLLFCFCGCEKKNNESISDEPVSKIEQSVESDNADDNTKTPSNTETSSDSETTESDTQTTSDSTSTPSDGNQNTSSDNKTSGQTPCKHSNTKFVSVSTGKNIIDSSKFDMINHAKICKDCSKQLGLEKHTVVNDKCTACSQSNFTISEVGAISAAVSENAEPFVAKINADGSLNYTLMLENVCWNAKNAQWLDDWNVKVAEKDIYNALKSKFIISDSQFVALKQQGTYDFLLGTQKYTDGYFYFTDPAKGGYSAYYHNVIGYKDNNNGTFSVYYDYVTGDDSPVSEHIYYYAVTYTYSGASNLSVTDNEGMYFIKGWKPVVDSLKVKSINKVNDISGITKMK